MEEGPKKSIRNGDYGEYSLALRRKGIKDMHRQTFRPSALSLAFTYACVYVCLCSGILVFMDAHSSPERSAQHANGLVDGDLRMLQHQRYRLQIAGSGDLRLAQARVGQ